MSETIMSLISLFSGCFVTVIISFIAPFATYMYLNRGVEEWYDVVILGVCVICGVAIGTTITVIMATHFGLMVL